MRITKTLMKIAMVIALVSIGLFGFGLPAMALDGPTPPQVGDPGAGAVDPHGGYSSLTDYCLQCHQVHSNPRSTPPDIAGEYALMAVGNVNATCATCHAIGGSGGGTPIDPGFEGTEGTASSRAVYTETAIHQMGATGGPGLPANASGWSFGWGYRDFTTYGPGPYGPSSTRAGVGTSSDAAGGFYCGSCHTPHGEFGQVVNSKWAVTTAGTGALHAEPWAEDSRIWWKDPADPTGETWTEMYLHDGGTSWQVCSGPGGTEPCYYAQVRDAEGQLVSLYGYKLLSSSPNHLYPVFPYTGAGGTPPAGLYSDSPITAGTLAAAVASTGSPITISVTETYTGTFPSVPFHIQIDSEKMLVTARTGGSYTVARPVDGTSLAAHSAGATVQILAGTVKYSIRSYNTDRYNHDGALWCGSCHTSRVDTLFGGQYHNHPTGCDACHGNDASGDADFPHSSSSGPEMLVEIPDALCLECHVAGSLP